MSYADTYASWQADPEAFRGKAAGQIGWITPAAIDDPAIPDEISDALKIRGLLK